MPIESSNPEAVTSNYSQWFMASLKTFGMPNRPVQLMANFVKYDPATGIVRPSGASQMQIADLFAEAAQDAELATIIGQLVDKAGRMAKARGVID